MRAANTYQPATYNNTGSVVAPSGYNDIPLPDATYPPEWPELESTQTFYRSGAGAAGGAGEGGGGNSALMQETFPWSPTAFTRDSNNSRVSGLINGQLRVNMPLFGSLMTDADQSTLSPHCDTIPRASNTNPGVSNLGPSVPVQPVNQLYSSGRGSAVNPVGSNSFAQAPRVVPLPSFIPPVGQERDPVADDSSTADTASVLTGPEDPLTDPLRCWCGTKLCNEVGLKYELHAMLLFTVS